MRLKVILHLPTAVELIGSGKITALHLMVDILSIYQTTL
jgi:hypothetical protein